GCKGAKVCEGPPPYARRRRDDATGRRLIRTRRVLGEPGPGQGNGTAASWLQLNPLWLLLPATASEPPRRTSQRYTDALLHPGGGGCGDAFASTPGQKYRLKLLSIDPAAALCTLSSHA